MPFNKHLKDDILDSLGEGVFTVDKSFKINFFNKSAERITGLNRNEVVGQFCKHVFNSKICYTDCPIAIVLNSKKNIYDFESEIHCPTGVSKQIKLSAAVLYNENKEPTGGVISFRDISDFDRIKKRLAKDSQFHGIIGHDKQMQEIYTLIMEVADSDAPVFIHGESGTGKEMIANAIQATSNRKDKPFIKINCSVFPDNLLASELFGHVKGAFTDAVKDRIGRFEIADGGTIFLDEVAEMPLQMQLQLLRVLQEGTFERVGESITRKVDVRIIAATNRDIEAALSKGTFREDLYYRLSVLPIYVPPLRERMCDVAPLTNYFLNKFSLMYKKNITIIDDEAMDIIMNYEWRGNVRELENVIEYAFVRTPDNENITISKLPILLKERVNNKKIKRNNFLFNNPEKERLIRTLEKHRWNKSKAAQDLGIGRTTLWRKLKALNIIED